jgi:hypothetical protein
VFGGLSERERRELQLQRRRDVRGGAVA